MSHICSDEEYILMLLSEDQEAHKYWLMAAGQAGSCSPADDLGTAKDWLTSWLGQGQVGPAQWKHKQLLIPHDAHLRSCHWARAGVRRRHRTALGSGPCRNYSLQET